MEPIVVEIGVGAVFTHIWPIETKSIKNHVTVIGGGIAGIESALNLANFGYDITLIELESEIGGHLKRLPVVAPLGKSGPEILQTKLDALNKNSKISVLTNTQVKYFEGEMGNFKIH